MLLSKVFPIHEHHDTIHQFGIGCVAQGHFDMCTRGTGGWTTNPLYKLSYSDTKLCQCLTVQELRSENWYWESEYSVALFTFTYYRHNVIKSVGKSHRFVFPLSLRVSVEFIPFHGFIPCPPSLGGRMISSLHRFTFLLPVDHFTCGSNNARKKSKVFVQPDLSQAQSHRNNDKSNWSFGVKSFIKRRLKLVRSPLQWDASAGTVAVNGFLKEHGLWF